MTASFLAALLLCAAPAAAYETFSLPNGLSVLLAPDRSVPVVALAWAVPVGSRQEPKGLSGFAHLFEHLMFQGSRHVPRGRFDKILEGLGAENNASTHQDHTAYYESLPAHALAAAFWLDADRLAFLDLTERSLRNQVDVVKEERRQSVENEPYAPLLAVGIASSVFSNWSNAHDGYGSFADLDAARLSDARAFFAAHNAPRGLRQAVVGDFYPAAARRLAERYLSWIPNAVPAPAAQDASEPPQTEERRFAVSDPLASLPAVALVWTGLPVRGSREAAAAALLGRYLGHGDASRLRQVLVKDAQVASAVDQPEGGLGFPTSDEDEYRAPGTFGFFVLRRPEAAVEKVRGLVLAEVASLARDGVPPAALARVKAALAGDAVRERQTALGRAQTLVRSWVLDGDPEAAQAWLETLMTITPEETRSAAAEYLTPGRLNLFDLSAGGAP
ncbi:MAG: insulinase family protein [Elusimicrobia bacterium]|nr:insulinase family protein [Elusimicrobiota bacterium]